MPIAIFGGAFDPFHSEHRKITEACANELHAEKVVLVPSLSPPHKNSVTTPFDNRAEMLRVGTSDLPYAVIDTIECSTGKKNPTYKILPMLKEKYPTDRLYFVMGGDSLINFHTWLRPEVVAKSAVLAVVKRGGYDGLEQAAERVKRDYNAEIVMLNVSGDEVSSSEIKASVELGLEPQNVNFEVAEYIKEHKLYSRFSKIVAQLKADIPQHTFVHSASAVMFSMGYLAKLQVDYQKAFTACLLHDCAKHTAIAAEGVPQAVAHQFAGAVRAKEFYGISDKEVLDAIECHTTGKPNMNNLEKLVYVSDMLESGRDFAAADGLRQMVKENFEQGFVACVKKNLEIVRLKNKPVHPLTEKCLEYYTVIKSNIKG